MTKVKIVEQAFKNKETNEVVKYKRLIIEGEINNESTQIELKLTKSELTLAEMLLASPAAVAGTRRNLELNEVVTITGEIDSEVHTLEILVDHSEYILAKILLKKAPVAEAQQAAPKNEVDTEAGNFLDDLDE